MHTPSYDQLKSIRFVGELLPNWAQMLDVAARLCPVSKAARRWFSLFTARSGVDDARTVIEYCRELQASLLEHREFVLTQLQQDRVDPQPAKILDGWMYALDTMILVARTRMTCPWTIAGTENTVIPDSDDGDITLRRV